MIVIIDRSLECREVARYVEGAGGDGGLVFLALPDETVSKLAVLDNGVEVAQTRLLFFALHFDLVRSLASGYPEDGVRGFLRTPSAAAGGLAQRARFAQGVRGQLAKRVVCGRCGDFLNRFRKVDQTRANSNMRQLRRRACAPHNALRHDRLAVRWCRNR